MPEEPMTPEEFQKGVEEATEEIYGKAAKENPPWAVSLMSILGKAIQAGFGFIWYTFLPYALKPAWEWIKAGYAKFTPAEDEAWEVVYSWLESNKIMSKSAAESLLRFKGAPGVLQSLFNFITLSMLLANYIKSVSDTVLTPTVQNLQAELTPNLPPIGSIMQAAFTAPEKTGEVRNIMKKNGLPDDYIDLMFIAAYRLYDEKAVQALWYRGEIDDAKVMERMKELGYTETRIAELRKLWPVIPPIQDLIVMVAHEAFEPDMIERYGLGSEFPAEQSKWMAAQGLNQYWQERYWNAHWVHPSPGQIMDMLHRQVKKPDGTPYSMADVYEYFRVVEIPPYWRKMLADISYTPYTRVDTRRMHQMGVLDDAELIKAYMDQGYDTEHASRMAEFTIKYNAQDKMTISKATVIRAFKDYMIPRQDALDLLTTMNVDLLEADWMLSFAEYENTLDLQEYYVKAAREKFTNLLWDEMTARSALMKLNLPGARIDALLELWKSQRISETKMPSKTDLDKFLRNGIIDKDAYMREMYKLGYNWNYVNYYTKLVEMKKAG